MACKVTTLAHESWNNSVKGGTLIAKSFLSSDQSMKVFCCLSNFVCKQLKRDSAEGLVIEPCGHFTHQTIPSVAQESVPTPSAHNVL